jgi:tetratricopeptide (TPR) repeat protein
MEWQKFLDDKLTGFIKNDQQVKQFKSLNSNFSRVQFLIENAGPIQTEIVKFLANSVAKAAKKNLKSEGLSEAYRKKGNEYYAKSNNKKALENYNFALIKAPANSKALVLSYSNRSAAFFSQKRLESCLADIDQVKGKLPNVISNLTEPNDLSDIHSLIFKLLNREINCHIKLNRPDFELDTNKLCLILKSEKFESQAEQTDQKIKTIQELFETYKKSLSTSNSETTEDKSNDVGSSPVIKNHISDLVDIKYSDAKGRYCTAHKKIQKGDCIFIEKPYSVILLPEFTHNYCQLCFKELYNDFDGTFHDTNNLECCDLCSEVFYCSQKCKNLAQSSSNPSESFHKFECGVIQVLLHNLGIAHLAYRILISTSLDTIVKYSSIEMSSTKANDIMQLNYKNESDAGDYEHVFNLLTHEKDTQMEDLFKYGLTSILLGKQYLSVCKESLGVNNKDELLVSASCLILRHLMQTICNAHAITRLRDSDTESASHHSTMNRDQIRYATAIYPRVSLLNHSCNSNVLSSFKHDSSTIVVKASRVIEQSAEIFNCYGPHYTKMRVVERQQSLLDQYHFRCDCETCVTQLASLRIETKRCGVKCLFCQSKEVTTLQSTKLKCEECSGELDLRDYWRIFEILQIEVDNVIALAARNSSRDLVDQLLGLISEFREYLLIGSNHEVDKSVKVHENFKMVYMTYSKLVDLLARLCSNLGDFEHSSDLVEKNIKLLAFLYNLDTSNYTSTSEKQSPDDASVEIAHELFKLAEIQCNCKRFQKAKENLEKAIRIAEVFYSKDNKILKDFYELKQNILSVL